MANIEHIHDPLDPIAFFKYDWLFEKHWTKSQNWKLYTKYAKFFIRGKRQPRKRLFNNFEQSRLVLKKWEYFLNEKLSKNSRFWQTYVLCNNFWKIDSNDNSRVIVSSLQKRGTTKKVWQTLNNSMTHWILLHFLNTIDFLRNIGRNRKTGIYIPNMENFLIHGKRQPRKRLFNNFEQSRLSIKEMRVFFKWKTIKKFAFLTDICFM